MDGPSSDYRYAVPTIIGALKRHFRDRGWLVRPPRRIQEVYIAVNKAIEDLTGDLRRPPISRSTPGSPRTTSWRVSRPAVTEARGRSMCPAKTAAGATGR